MYFLELFNYLKTAKRNVKSKIFENEHTLTQHYSIDFDYNM